MTKEKLNCSTIGTELRSYPFPFALPWTVPAHSTCLQQLHQHHFVAVHIREHEARVRDGLANRRDPRNGRFAVAYGTDALADQILPHMQRP
jgi:hypothetical protein